MTLDGKVYPLGGRDPDVSHVYALDLGQQSDLECTALDVKTNTIHKEFEKDFELEVYDRMEDTWSFIEYMPWFSRQFHWCSAVGEELVVMVFEGVEYNYKY